jgi:hypothetical protein
VSRRAALATAALLVGAGCEAPPAGVAAADAGVPDAAPTPSLDELFGGDVAELRALFHGVTGAFEGADRSLELGVETSERCAAVERVLRPALIEAGVGEPIERH